MINGSGVWQLQPRPRSGSIRSLPRVIPRGRRGGAGSGRKGQNSPLRSIPAWKTGWPGGFEAGGSGAGCREGNTVWKSGSSLPTSPKGMSVQLRLRRSLQLGSLASGTAAAAAVPCCPSRGVSVFQRFRDLAFSKAQQRQVGAHLQGIEHPTLCVPCAEPFREPAHPARTALGCRGGSCRGARRVAGLELCSRSSPGQRGLPGALLKNSPELQLQHN